MEIWAKRKFKRPRKVSAAISQKGYQNAVLMRCDSLCSHIHPLVVISTWMFCESKATASFATSCGTVCRQLYLFAPATRFALLKLGADFVPKESAEVCYTSSPFQQSAFRKGNACRAMDLGSAQQLFQADEWALRGTEFHACNNSGS